MKSIRPLFVAALALTFSAVPLLPQNSSQDNPPPQAPKITRIKQGGNITSHSLISRVNAVYPKEALDKHIQGTVRLHVIIARDGLVQKVDLLSGDKLLADAGIDAVRQWKYRPTLLNGEPVEVDTAVDLIFSLSDDRTPR